MDRMPPPKGWINRYRRRLFVLSFLVFPYVFLIYAELGYTGCLLANRMGASAFLRARQRNLDFDPELAHVSFQ
jgi:glucose-6-phosphate-specific signal transduction histidine kinase